MLTEWLKTKCAAPTLWLPHKKPGMEANGDSADVSDCYFCGTPECLRRKITLSKATRMKMRALPCQTQPSCQTCKQTTCKRNVSRGPFDKLKPATSNAATAIRKAKT